MKDKTEVKRPQGAPRKLNGTKKVQVTISVMEKVVEFYGGKIPTSRKCEEILNKAFDKESKVKPVKDVE